MNSHDLAKALRELAEKLEAHEPFPVGIRNTLSLHYYDKSGFIPAVRVIGGVKNTDSDFFFALTQKLGPLEIEVSTQRSNVCRQVKKLVTKEETVWECEPLLSEAEEAEVTR